MGMNSDIKKAGLYIHVPFCSKKCNYCDFYSFPADENTKTDYVNAVLKHAKKCAHVYNNVTFDTVYIGGGTPTSLPPDLLFKLIEGLHSCFNICGGAEFTMETNPGLSDDSVFDAIRRAGVNRLSIGLQSANPDELNTLGRIHTTDDYVRTVYNARKAGIGNISTDIMFSLPSQTAEKLEKTLDFVKKSGSTHVSAYSLKIEEGTMFYRIRKSLSLPNEDADADMYLQIVDNLAKNGYKQYEISNFAIPGYESAHNLKYWRCEEYLGLGPSAHSYMNNVRYAYRRNAAEYINVISSSENYDSLISEFSEITETEHKREKIMLGLRLSSGVNDSDLAEIASLSCIYEKIRPLIDGGFIIKTENGIALTPRGMYVSNTIINMILGMSIVS